MTKIISKENKLVKEIIKLKQKKFRIASNRFIIEGEKFVKEIPKDWVIDKIIVSEEFAAKKSQSYDFVLSNDLFKYVSDTSSPQGIMAVCKKKVYELFDLDLSKNLLFVAVERLNDPGNLGTLIRSCVAFGVDTLLLSKNSVDVYNPKVLRACAGNIFKLKVVEDLDFRVELNKIKQYGFKVFATSSNVKCVCLSNVDFKQKSILIFGNEASGISRDVMSLCDAVIKIPISDNVESLNISVSAGILLYETYLQRR